MPRYFLAYPARVVDEILYFSHLTRSSAYEIITIKEHGKTHPKRKHKVRLRARKTFQF